MGDSITRTTNKLILDEASDLEEFGTSAAMAGLRQFRQAVGAGPGTRDVAAGVQATRDFASSLADVAAGQGPTAADRQFAQAQLAPERLALQRGLEDAQTAASRQAALLGRSTATDPILQSRLARERIFGEQMLGAREGALQFAGQQRRLGFQAQQANVLSQLGAQALRNRTALAGLGQAIQGSERQFRLATGTQEQTVRKTPSPLETFMGIATGIAGLGTGIGNAVGGFMGGGGGDAPSGPDVGARASAPPPRPTLTFGTPTFNLQSEPLGGVPAIKNYSLD